MPKLWIHHYILQYVSKYSILHTGDRPTERGERSQEKINAIKPKWSESGEGARCKMVEKLWLPAHTNVTRGIVASHTSKKFSPRHPQFAYKSSLTYWNSNKLLPSYFCRVHRKRRRRKLCSEKSNGTNFKGWVINAM